MSFDARLVVVLALGLGVGCGRSIRHETDAGAGGSSGSSGVSSGGKGVDTGGTGGTSGSSGSVTGGASGRGTGGSGTGGAGTSESSRLFFETSGALVSTDFDGGEPIELCAADASAQYTMIGIDGERLIFFRQHLAPTDGDIVRVALDGSECETIHSGKIVWGLPPVGGRVVFAIESVFASPELEYPAPPEPIPITPTGLASIGTDGKGYEVLATGGVTNVQIVGERVVFTQSAVVYSVLPNATDQVALVPGTEPRGMGPTTGHRLIVNVNGDDVFAVDNDGGRLLPLSTGPDRDAAVAIVGDSVVIRRTLGTGNATQHDLHAIPLAGGEAVPLATTPDYETFIGASGDRVFYVYGVNGDLRSVNVDGSDMRPIGSGYFTAVGASRVVFWHVTSVSSTSTRTDFLSTNLDGTDPVTLLENASGFGAIVGDRVVLSVGTTTDLVSVPITGGDAIVLAASPQQKSVAGRLGHTLVIQSGPYYGDGEVIRIGADGSARTVLMPSARYLGAVTEACGAVPGGGYDLSACPEE